MQCCASDYGMVAKSLCSDPRSTWWRSSARCRREKAALKASFQSLLAVAIGLTISLSRRSAWKISHLFLAPNLEPLPGGAAWGRMTTDFRLPGAGQSISSDCADWLRAAVAKHRIVLLRRADVDILSPAERAEAHVALARAISDGQGIEERLGERDASGHPSLFRVSNDPARGARGVGTNGWHVDGTHKLSPQLMHSFQCVASVEGADTYFIPFDELYSAQNPAVQERWASLWFRSGRGIFHAFVHAHPVTKRPALCLFMGSHLCSFVKPLCDDARQSVAEAIQHGQFEEVDMGEIHDQIRVAIDAKPDLVYRHEWMVGDVLIHDNLATAHLASPGTQAAPEHAGLRILDRASVLSSGPLAAVQGAERSFVDKEERRTYLWKLWHSPLREQMNDQQLQGLVRECQSVGLNPST